MFTCQAAAAKQHADLTAACDGAGLRACDRDNAATTVAAGGAEDDAEPSEPSGPLDRSLVLNTAWDDMDRTGSGAVDKAVLRHALVTLGELAGSAVGEQVRGLGWCLWL